MCTRLSILVALVLVLRLGLPLQSTARADASDSLVVIIGAATSLTDISLAQLRQAFSGERAEVAGGLRLIPFNQAQGTRERQLFDRVVLGLEPSEVGHFWIKRRLRDEGLPPRKLPDARLGARVVAGLPGAITYLRASAVQGPVRILTIDGKAPGQPGYLLPRLESAH